MIKLRVVVAGLCLLALSTSADTNGVSLTLHFPHSEMLADEWFDYSLTLSNGSPHDIFIMKDPRSMIPCQMAVQGICL